jgi:hypothetical protein
MNNSNQIINIHQKFLCLNEFIPINIGFTYSNTLFDNTIKYLLDNTINFIEYNKNIISYQCIIINNPIDFSTKDPDNSVNKILFFHDETILRMKKEDQYLLQEKLAKYKKYSFNKNICSLFSNIQYINYGFQNNSSYDKDKDVLLIGGNNQNIESLIFNQIKNKFPNSRNINLKEIHETNIDLKTVIEQYKICLCTNSRYSRLLAASCGCFVISFEEDNEIPYHLHLNSLESIIDNISNIITNYENMKHQQTIISEKICSKYNYAQFNSQLKNIIKENLL